MPPGRLLAAAALVALIGAGCSNAPAETGGAEDPAPTGSPVPDAGERTDPAGPPPSPAALEERRESARCMRENGVEDFPDPDAAGHILYYGDDPDMESAREKCGRLQPGDGGREPGFGG